MSRGGPDVPLDPPLGRMVFSTALVFPPVEKSQTAIWLESFIFSAEPLMCPPGPQKINEIVRNPYVYKQSGSICVTFVP